MLQLALIAAGGYALAVGGLYLLQDGMVFPRSATAPPRRPLPPDAEHWSLEVGQGVDIHGIHLPGPDAAAPLVLGFPGNAWNAQDFALFLRDCLPQAAITAFHYRGYAPSEGRPSERALAADADAVLDAMARRWPERRVVLVGISLGSGVAAHALDAPNVAGAVLVTPFDSIRAVARESYPWVPVGALLRHPFDSAANIAGSDKPVAILSAADDELIRPARTEALVAQARRLVHRHVFAGAGHNTVFDHPDFAPVLEAALAAVVAGQPPQR